jgi:hypothetical protein
MGAGNGTGAVLAAATVYVEMARATLVKELMEKRLVKDARGRSTAESIVHGNSNSQTTHTVQYKNRECKDFVCNYDEQRVCCLLVLNSVTSTPQWWSRSREGQRGQERAE